MLEFIVFQSESEHLLSGNNNIYQSILLRYSFTVQWVDKAICQGYAIWLTEILR